MDTPLKKFIPFSKVDSVQRLVSGIVTAERPDKDFEICEYEKSKPYYEKWSSEFQKATDGQSVGNLREMHQLWAVGVGKTIQFNDNEKEIVMTFKVIDDDAWKKVEERVYTGFSQGGRKVAQYQDPVNKRYARYVANPSEISLVDNPCLPDARFAMVKADGSVEMMKFLRVEDPAPTSDERITALEQELTLLKSKSPAQMNVDQPGLEAHLTDIKRPAEGGTHVSAPVQDAPGARVDITDTDVRKKDDVKKEAKTKRVAGKDLTASNFAYVGDPDKTETWKFPIHDASHVKNALARWNQAKGIPETEKAKVRAKIVAAARKFGIEVTNEKDKAAAILVTMRKAVRRYVNTHEGIVSQRLDRLDLDLGKSIRGGFEIFKPLSKGMWEVSRMACSLEELCCLLYSVCAEQEWELDEDSQLPGMLAENIGALTETFIAMVDEETREMLEQVRGRVGNAA